MVNVHNHWAGLGVQVPKSVHIVADILAAIPRVKEQSICIQRVWATHFSCCTIILSSAIKASLEDNILFFIFYNNVIHIQQHQKMVIMQIIRIHTTRRRISFLSTAITTRIEQSWNFGVLYKRLLFLCICNIKRDIVKFCNSFILPNLSLLIISRSWSFFKNYSLIFEIREGAT